MKLQVVSITFGSSFNLINTLRVHVKANINSVEEVVEEEVEEEEKYYMKTEL